LKNLSRETNPDNSEHLSDVSSCTDSSPVSSRDIPDDENYGHISVSPCPIDKDSPYFLNLPSNWNIFINASETIRKIEDPKKRKHVVDLLLSLQDVLLKNRFALDSIGSLPPLRITINGEDDSVLIEWIFRDFRIGFSIEANHSQSNWYLVANENLKRVDQSGLLSSQNIDDLLTSLIAFVLSNT
jgi:hypothetical protein